MKVLSSSNITAMTVFLAVTINVQVLAQAPIQGECEKDEDCVTGACVTGFQAPDTPGVCVCNEETNAGCIDGEEVCMYPPGLDDGFPDCLADMGQECQYDFDCATNRCFYGEQPDVSPGICHCNSETNAGCDDGWICSDADLDRDGFPKCALPVGSNCDDNNDCETNLCFSNFLIDGICICELKTNLGCPEGQVCSANPQLSDVPPSCVVECTTNEDCETNTCFDRQCQCNPTNNLGCDDGQVCFGDDIGGYRCVSGEETPTTSPGEIDPVETNLPTASPTPTPTTTSTPGDSAGATPSTPAPTTGSGTVGSPQPSSPAPTAESTSNVPSAFPTDISSAVRRARQRIIGVILPFLLGLVVAFLSS